VCCTFAVSHLLQGGFVSERVLSRLDDESETGRDGLGGFGGFGLFGWGHCGGSLLVSRESRGLEVVESGGRRR
jgi:hypothetical protein